MSELKQAVCELILEHIRTCEERFQKITSASDFVETDEGRLLLDAISMRLQAIGENVKRLVKLDPSVTEKKSSVDWQSIIRFRDFISHHYEMLDYEVIFDIAKYQLPVLKTAITQELE